MSVINSSNAPDVSVVKPHFIFGAISLLIFKVVTDRIDKKNAAEV